MSLEAAEVGGDRVGRRGQEVVEPVRAQQQALVLDLGDHRAEERLLPVDAGEVAAVAEAVPGADVGQRLLALDGVRAGLRGPGATAGR